MVGCDHASGITSNPILVCVLHQRRCWCVEAYLCPAIVDRHRQAVGSSRTLKALCCRIERCVPRCDTTLLPCAPVRLVGTTFNFWRVTCGQFGVLLQQGRKRQYQTKLPCGSRGLGRGIRAGRLRRRHGRARCYRGDRSHRCYRSYRCHRSHRSHRSNRKHRGNRIHGDHRRGLIDGRGLPELCPEP